MSARTDAAELARRVTALRMLNDMTAERNNAIMQRDEARSLGRCA